MLLPAINKIFADEVELFFLNDQSLLTPMDVEYVLLNQVNNRFLSLNKKHGLKGAGAYHPIQTLPPVVIA